MFSGHTVVLTMLNFFVTECKYLFSASVHIRWLTAEKAAGRVSSIYEGWEKQTDLRNMTEKHWKECGFKIIFLSFSQIHQEAGISCILYPGFSTSLESSSFWLPMNIIPLMYLLPFISQQDSFCTIILWLIPEHISRVGEQEFGFPCFLFLNAMLMVQYLMNIVGHFQNQQ